MISQNDIAVATTLLNRYLAVHKEVFGFSLRKVIPIPFLFKKTDFPYLWSEAEEIACELGKWDGLPLLRHLCARLDVDATNRQEGAHPISLEHPRSSNL